MIGVLLRSGEDTRRDPETQRRCPGKTGAMTGAMPSSQEYREPPEAGRDKEEFSFP